MANNCDPCGTANAPLITIDPDKCELNLHQVQRIAVYKYGNVYFDTANALNNFPASISGLAPTDIAAWDILSTLAAGPEEDSKVVFLPLFGGAPIIEPGAEITFGGGNETINGAIQHIDYENSNFSARWDGLTALKESQIEGLKCEGNRMEVFMINYEDKLFGKRDGDIWKGIKVDTALITLGKNVAGRDAKDSNVFKFELKREWSLSIEPQTPVSPFSPLNY